MKKVAPIIMAMAIIIFSIPVLHCKADSGLFGVYTQESIGTVFEDTTLQNKLNSILLTNEQIDTYDVFDLMDNASFDITTDNIVIITFISGGGYAIQSFDVPEDVGFIYYDSSTSPRSGYYYCVNDNSDQTVAGRTPITGNIIYSVNLVEDTISREMSAFYPWGSGQQAQLTGDGCLLYSPIPVYSKAEAIDNGAPSSTSSSDNLYLWMLNNADTLTDIRGDGAVWNGTEIVYPSDIEPETESISNHLYAKNFDVFFCNTRQLMSNPYGMANIGGGYLCVKYDLDDYARTNIGNLVLSFNYSCTFGETVYTGAYQGRLDSSGYVIIPINQAFQNNPYFLAKYDMVLATSKNTFYQDFCEMKPYYFTRTQWDAYKEVYQDYLPGGIDDTPQEYQLTAQKLEDILSNTPFVYLIDKYENINLPNIPASAVVMKNLGYVLDGKVQIYSPDLNVAKFDCVCKLLNEQDIFETSGEFKKTINFKTGVSSISDNGITVNPNPFDGTGTYDIMPSDDEYGIVSSGGTAYATVGNIVNQITFPTYKELKYDLESNPDGNFTQYLSPLSNNQFGTWFLSFVNEMPPQVKSLLITGVGVGVLFGIMRYVRRG